MAAYYNEIEPYAAAWLRNLIAAGHIAPGEVDTRSIVEVSPDDLRGFTQCHFFAGIGVWSYALRRAGWADDRPVWTGSCPCQPFSTAGRRKGHEDERHLWPTWFRLIRECRPVAIFGEQVANGDGAAWLDHVATDLEGDDYAVGAVSAPACGFGAPHIRQRLYWVGHTMQSRRQSGSPVFGVGAGLDGAGEAAKQLGHSGGRADELAHTADGGHKSIQRVAGVPGAETCGVAVPEPCAVGNASGMADAELPERRPQPFRSADDQHEVQAWAEGAGRLGECCGAGPLAHASSARLPEQRGRRDEPVRSATAGFWGDAEWLPCRDGKARPVEPGTFPLAHGAPARVGRLRAYGNAINAEQATEFIRAALMTPRRPLTTATVADNRWRSETNL